MNLALSLALASATGLGTAQGTAPAGSTAQKAPDKSMHSVEAEVVSADAEGNTVTFTVDGGQKTLPVGVLGRYRLREIKAGDRVLLTCKDREGEHLEVVSIRSSRKAEAEKAGADKKAAPKQ
jgi:hypothetical protein